MPLSQSPPEGKTEKQITGTGEVAKRHPLSSLGRQQATPISFRYLTFETRLPPFTLLSGDPTLSPPILSKYTSPFSWPASQKNMIVLLSCVGTGMTAFSAGSLPPAIPQMSRLWHVSDVALSVGLTTWCVGFAIAPMMLAPFSELEGRRPVFVLSGILFTVCQLCCAVTRSYIGMLVARFFVGVGAATFGSVVGGVLADIFVAEERNTAMALFSGSVLAGTGLGPMVSGIIAEYTSWRWIFYAQTISNAVMVVAVALYFRETRGSVLLSRKAKILNRWYESCERSGSESCLLVDSGIRWKVESDEEHESLRRILIISLTRPFYLLATEPVIFFFSLWAAFSWGVLYMSFSSITLVFGTRHGFNLAQSGGVFSAIPTGAIIATGLSLYLEHLRKKKPRQTTDRTHNPERRLYFTCIGSALMPIGMLWYGWTSFSNIPWIVPTLAVGCFTMGIYFVYLSVFNYLADTYGWYASSAIAAQSFCRNIFGGVLPLVNDLMFRKLTYQGASSFLGGVGFLLALVPWVLVLYGPQIRRRSKFAAGLNES